MVFCAFLHPSVVWGKIMTEHSSLYGVIHDEITRLGGKSCESIFDFTTTEVLLVEFQVRILILLQ